MPGIDGERLLCSVAGTAQQAVLSSAVGLGIRTGAAGGAELALKVGLAAIPAG